MYCSVVFRSRTSLLLPIPGVVLLGVSRNRCSDSAEGRAGRTPHVECGSEWLSEAREEMRVSRCVVRECCVSAAPTGKFSGAADAQRERDGPAEERLSGGGGHTSVSERAGSSV